MIDVKKFQKFIFLLSNLFILTYFVGILPANAFFQPTDEPYSQGVYMVNIETGTVVYSKNAGEKFYPASITKIMTAMLTLEKVPDLDAKVDVPQLVMNEFDPSNPNKYGPSHADIRTGQDNLTYRDCLYALMLASACEAGNILAYNIGGDIETFVKMMNEKAKEIGCENTNFGNPHGLHQTNNYSTPYDMYLISKYAYDSYEGFMEVCNTYQYSMPKNSNNPTEYDIITTNKLISSNSEFYYEYAKGIKTGSIDLYYDLETGESTEGHSSFVSIAQKENNTYMLVTMGAPFYNVDGSKQRGNYHFKDHIALYDWAFDSIEYRNVLSKNEIIQTIDVLYGQNVDTVQLKPAADYGTLLPKGIDNSAIQKIVTLINAEVEAPVQKGAVLGEVELRLSDESLTTIMLIAADDVEESKTSLTIKKIKDMLSTPWFKGGVALLIVLMVTISVIRYKNAGKKNRTKRNNPRRR